MRLRFLTSLVLVTALVSVVFAEGDDTRCHASARECSQQIRQYHFGRRYLGVQVVELKPGLVIKSVLPESPASRVQLMPGDRLIAVNGRPLTQANVARFKQHLAEASGTGKILLIVQRRGAYRRIEVRLEPYPTEYIEKVIAGHLSQLHTTTAGAQP